MNRLDRLYDKNRHYFETAMILQQIGRDSSFYEYLFAKSAKLICLREAQQESLVADGIEAVVRGAREAMVNETPEVVGKYL